MLLINFHLDFLDYYHDLLQYTKQRKSRLVQFKEALNQTPTDTHQKQLKTYFGKERAFLRKRRTRLTISHFKIISQIGQGGYGKVFLARYKQTDQICALKQMSKNVLKKMGEVQHILTERDILTSTDTPFLTKLLFAFQDTQSIYLAMEFVPGGDLRTLFNNSGCLKEEHARFYISEMFISVSELHRLGYIHRDLKPENFLIDAQGHIKLTDFGLSRGALSHDVIQSLTNNLSRLASSNPTYKSISERKSLFSTIRGTGFRAMSLVGSPDYMVHFYCFSLFLKKRPMRYSQTRHWVTVVNVTIGLLE